MKVNIHKHRNDNNNTPRPLSREDKRRLAKRYNLSMDMVERIFKDATIKYEYETFIEGSKVKLNYDRIMENKEGKSEKYLEFVELHKDKELTIEYDALHKDNPSVFCLKEDTNTSKWLFDISDLILIEMANPPEETIDNN
jgi:hypothetical protein